ncbi:glycosyltransferase [Amycolatopsis panacis]|uniref:glycosyltransferase n=1 Tax=Amycolatopsis panacis TaxID=2340917 RepID=UPI0011C37CDA|nr:glycosyltransferase [Amycolatopsis panacis]
MSVVFVPYPARGHLGPFLAVAAELARLGVSVRMVLPVNYAGVAAACGVAPLIAGSDRGAHVPPGWALSTRVDRWRERRRSATAIERTFGDDVARRPPRLIVADPHTRWGRALPGTRVAWLWTTVPRSAAGREPVLVNGMPTFEPPRGLTGRVRFHGPLLAPEQSPQRLDLPPGRVALASFGTVFAHSTRWLRELANAFAGSDWQLVLATGSAPVAALGSLPPNVLAFQTVPQRVLLERVDVFLGHGGMNSLLEAAWAGVPMMLHPRSREQARNARRLVGLGVATMLGSVRGLPGRLDTLVEGRAAEVAELRARVRAAPGPRAAARQLLHLAELG